MTRDIQLFEDLLKHLRHARWRVLGIDGFPGVGKTTLASRVAGMLGIRCVHLDDFLACRQGGFLDFLRYSELLAVLEERPVIVEGVCLRAVMERLSIETDLLIYVKPHGDAEIMKSADFVVAEVREYNRQYSPAEAADIVYKSNLPVDEVISDSDRDSEHAAALRDVALINSQTKLALALAAGGMLTLIVGLVVLLYGVSGQDEALMKFGATELSARGIGGVIMITSVVWAFFAYQCRPVYRRKRETAEVYDPETQKVTERRERRSSTLVR